jgi:TPR repeat protein
VAFSLLRGRVLEIPGVDCLQAWLLDREAQKSAARGDYSNGRLMSRSLPTARVNYAKSLRLSRPLAELGDPRAQSILGLLYLHGRGVPQDDLGAAYWFRLAAEQGDAHAQFNIGLVYAEGRGMPQDYAEAARWYRLAADRSHAQAQYNLALAYAKGEGVSQDYVSAHMWSTWRPRTSRRPKPAITSWRSGTEVSSPAR